MKELHFTKRDFRVACFSRSSAAEYHRNKHLNYCRITPIATGLRPQGTENQVRTINLHQALPVCAASYWPTM